MFPSTQQKHFGRMDAENQSFSHFLRKREKELHLLYQNLPELSEKQQKVGEEYIKGKNVFLTGSPGCGKSVALLSTIRLLLSEGFRKNVDFFIGAPTGVSAYLIGGYTLHKLFHLPIEKDVIWDEVFEGIMPQKRARWRRLKYLIIDEISMVSGRILSMIDYFLRKELRNNLPFGGVYVLAVGDFCQLPPVPDFGQDEDFVEFAFETKVWKQAQFMTVNLIKPFRQNDKTFVQCITRLRYGNHTEKDVEYLKKRVNVPILANEFGILPTFLFTHRYMVDELNRTQLEQLSGEKHVFEAKQYCENEMYLKELENICPSPYTLVLKEGAQVMVTKNIYDVGGTNELILTNGTKGVVKEIGEDWTEIEKCPKCALLLEPQEPVEEPPFCPYGMCRFEKFPFVLCVFENGLHYKFHEEEEMWQVIYRKELKAYRKQIPLLLCWAITIHKSQGQTLSRGVISIQEAFASGQAMVAISRFRNLEDFSILGDVNPYKIRANERVIDFYNDLKYGKR